MQEKLNEYRIVATFWDEGNMYVPGGENFWCTEEKYAENFKGKGLLEPVVRKPAPKKGNK